MLYLTHISFFYFFCNDLKHLCNRIFSGAYDIILLTVIQRLPLPVIIIPYLNADLIFRTRL